MNFIAQYGLFLLQVFTLVIAFLVLLMGIAGIKRKPKPKFEITSFNKEYTDLQFNFNQTIKGKKIAKKLKKKAEKEEKPSLYVIDFIGDMKATQVENLRKEVTAVLAIVKPGDEIVVRLESPGGVVNAYGLAASQLQRIRNHNIPLTVCIDKIAASGGYLMSCVANTIIAAPFAIVGSIGVVAQIPNFHRWLKKNDIDVELITAGEYKRTLTLLGENTEKGRKKFQEDIEKIHQSFRNYVLTHRPILEIEKIATGEYWLAIDALPLHLVDDIKTSDDYLIEKMAHFAIFHIARHQKQSFSDKLLKPFALTRKLSSWIMS